MSMNKIFASGRLTADPETREAAGSPVTTFTLACDTRTKDGNGGTITNFYRCSVWRGLGDTCAKYLHKGDKLEIVGDLCLRSYVDTKGVQRSSLDVTVGDVSFNFPKREETGAAPAAPRSSQPPAMPVIESDGLPF